MYQTVNFCDFCDAFRDMDRNENFSYEAKRILFDYMEDMETEGPGIELDVIALCCDYQESTYAEVIQDYNLQDIDQSDEDEMENLVIEYLEENTCVLGSTSSSVVFASF